MNWPISTTFIITVLISTYSALARSGEFEGDIVTKWINERDMMLVEDVRYLDDKNIIWHAPSGAVINGASIPKILWSTIGPPYVGKYRAATVFHDHYCNTKTTNWKDVHRMFYYAMIDSGVKKSKAKTMFMAVYAFGPRWEKIEGVGSEDFYEWNPSVTNSAHEELKSWIASDDPGVEEIESRVDGISQQ